MRPHWHDHFMKIAHVVSEMATCDRKHVGAVLVDGDKRIVATGFNGSPAGQPHCDDAGHQLVPIDGRPSCVRTLHAESNAIDYAGQRARGCTLFTTVVPCFDCAKRIVNAGVVKVYYDEDYDSRNTLLGRRLFEEAGVPLIRRRLDGATKKALGA